MESELYRTLTRLIERGQTEGLREKIDVFFAVSSISEDEYRELIAKLPSEDTAEL